VIERPSYAYELASRFERTYGDVLSLSSVSHIYTALATLKGRSLVQEIPGTRTGRQPKPRYRATEQGLSDYAEWLVNQVGEDTRRERLFVLQLATFTADPDAALAILDRYEQACHSQARAIPLVAHAQHSLGAAADLGSRLASEQARLALGAKLAWVQYARTELRALRDARTPRR
jgi:DNA-binding PadR family transcriptional regulator